MTSLRIGFMAAATVMAASLAMADELTSQQQQQIYKSIINDKNSVDRPPAFNASKGSELPSSVQLNTFPDAVNDPAVRQYQYVVTGKQVIVADPSTRKIISVIEK
jgi:hypothetical protein